MEQHLRDCLATHQSQLLAHFDSLDDAQKGPLAEQLAKFDFARLGAAFKQALEPHLPDAEQICPVEADRYVDREHLGEQELYRLESIALKAIAEGRVGAIVLAGGQASRLGSERPKGVIPLGTGLGTSSTDSLLFIQAAQIARLQRMAAERFAPNGKAPKITWLLMTSQTTDAETRAHLDKILQQTGLEWEQVLVFSQSEIPAFDLEGRALLKSANQLVTSPDGNGGFYDAIRPILPELERHGVEYLHIYCVDNILCRVADPYMLGCAIMKGADCTLKVIEKKDPGELVGHVCLEQGRVRVLEYSEIPRELAERRDPYCPDKLFLRAGSIANHLVTMQFLKKACSSADSLPYHVAKKRITHWDSTRKEEVNSKEPNGIKLERFIFDAFCHSTSVLVWQVPAAEEFSPLKNPESVGRDCLSTCLRSLQQPHAQWLREACLHCLQQPHNAL